MDEILLLNNSSIELGKVKRREFIKALGLAGAGIILTPSISDTQILANPVGMDYWYFAQCYIIYFQAIVEESQKRLPPGKNAANGGFRDAIASKSFDSIGCSYPYLSQLGGEEKALWDIFVNTHSLIHKAFESAPNHPDSWSRNFPLFWTNSRQLVGDVISGVSAVIKFFSGGDREKAEAVRDLTNSIQDAAEKVEKSGVLWSGSHANGWISKNMQTTANSVIQQLDSNFPPGTATEGGKIADILRATFGQIAQLPTDGHNPWLRPDWQIKFQAYLASAVSALRSHYPPIAVGRSEVMKLPILIESDGASAENDHHGEK